MEAHGGTGAGVGAIVVGIELGTLTDGQGVVVGSDMTVGMGGGGRS